MENFQRNKFFSDVFTRYLKDKFGWEYVSIESHEDDVDVVLSSEGQENLSLQLKEVKRHIKTERTPMTPGSKSKLSLFESTLHSLNQIVKEYENKYADANNLILILHLCDGYFIPSDTQIINKVKFAQSKFRGIYLVSPGCELFGTKGSKSQQEFVCAIKDAFISK